MALDQAELHEAQRARADPAIRRCGISRSS